MAVAFDAKPTAWNSADGLNQQVAANTTISASTGFAVGAGANCLVAVINYQKLGSDPGTISAWTWNGVARTGLLQGPFNVSMRSAIAWWANPATGTQTMSATWANSGDAYMSCASFTGVDTTTPVIVADSVTGNSGTTVTVTSDANGVTVACWGTDGSTPTVNFNKIYAEAPLNPGAGASYQLGGTSNGHTFTGAGGSSPSWAGVHLQAAAAAAAQDQAIRNARTASRGAGPAVQRFLFRQPPLLDTSVAMPTQTDPGPAPVRITNRFVGPPVLRRSAMRQLWQSGVLGRQDFAFAAEAGSYALTGQPAGLLATRLLNVSAGSYTLTGQAASVLAGRLLKATAGSYAVTGKAATLAAARLLNAGAGAYTYTGKAGALLRGALMPAVAGAYVINGADADLQTTAAVAFVFGADPGSYSLAGLDASLTATTVPTMAQSTPGLRRLGRARFNVEDEAEKLARRIREGTIKPPPVVQAPKDDSAYFRESAQLATAIAAARADAETSRKAIARYTKQQELKAHSAAVEAKLIRAEQALLLARITEEALMEEMEVIDIAYLAVVALSITLQ